MASPIDILFQPFGLKNLKLRNRFVMSPMTRNFSPGGIPGENVAAYYRRRAAADVGLIITEGIGVDHPSALGAGSMGERDVPVLHGDAVAAWAKVTAGVHAQGGAIIPQLWHMGGIRRSGTGPFPQYPSMRPSGIWGPTEKAILPPDYLHEVSPPTTPMSENDIADIIAAYARSAANAQAADFDGVAIHAAHGYLIDSFFWPGTNLRDDAWGGDITRRVRFGVEVVKAVRAAVGPNFPVILRFSQWKIQDYDARNAQTPDELASLLGPLSEGGVDLFDASTRKFTTPAFAGSDMGLAGWAKKLTGKPSMAVGGIGLDKDLQTSFVEETRMVNNLDVVAARMARGEFDLAGMGRALIMDPEWVLKARRSESFQPFRLQAYGALD
ncbi:oxidoreductase [Acidocella aquatica]|uniref:Oxidoreductase n=1 Tax=Acidocella aquatica TaxID=1922313 RepID=A0ABQ6A838_9PROT|nr:12-oxophytodienoate reductase [Acidocella aquatica]GLR68374.1 oxidoreductase [Acidocella aquatica]